MTKTRWTAWCHRFYGKSCWSILFLGTLALGLAGSGCGGGDDDVTGLGASFADSGTAAQNNAVRLIGGLASGDVVTVEVVCGKTDRDDVYGFAFDLVLSDTSVAQYVTGSIEAGNALGENVILAAQQRGERIVIGVTQTDQTGDAIPGPESVVVRLALRVLKTGTTGISFEGSTGSNPTDDPAAIDSSGTPIGTIVFDPVSATLIGR